jgi:hypothetical protein
MQLKSASNHKKMKSTFFQFNLLKNSHCLSTANLSLLDSAAAVGASTTGIAGRE